MQQNGFVAFQRRAVPFRTIQCAPFEILCLPEPYQFSKTWFEIALEQVQCSAAKMRIRIVGIDFDCPFIALPCLAQSSLLLQCCAQIVVCFCIIWLQLDRSTVSGNGFVELSSTLQGAGQIVLRRDKARIDRDGSNEAGNRLVDLALTLKQVALVEVRPGKIRLEYHRSFVTLQRFFNFTLLL